MLDTQQSSLSSADIGGIFSYNQQNNAIKQREGSNITVASIKALFQSNQIRQAKSLSFQFEYFFYGYSCGGIRAAECKALVDAFKKYDGNSLAELHFANCNLDDKKALALLEAIRHNKKLSSQLTILSLVNTHISAVTLQYINDQLIPATPRLTTVTIEGQGIGNVGSGRGPGPDPSKDIRNKHRAEMERIYQSLAKRTGEPPQQDANAEELDVTDHAASPQEQLRQMALFSTLHQPPNGEQKQAAANYQEENGAESPSCVIS